MIRSFATVLPHLARNLRFWDGRAAWTADVCDISVLEQVFSENNGISIAFSPWADASNGCIGGDEAK